MGSRVLSLAPYGGKLAGYRGACGNGALEPPDAVFAWVAGVRGGGGRRGGVVGVRRRVSVAWRTLKQSAYYGGRPERGRMGGAVQFRGDTK